MKAGSDLAMLSCLTLFIFCFTTSLLQSLTPLIPGKCSVYSHIPLVYSIPNYTVLPSLLFFPSWPFSFFYFKYYFFYSNIFKSLSLPHIWFVGEDFLVPVKMNKETWILVSFFLTLTTCETWSETLVLSVWMSNLLLQNMGLESLFKRFLLNLKLKFYIESNILLLFHSCNILLLFIVS